MKRPNPVKAWPVPVFFMISLLIHTGCSKDTGTESEGKNLPEADYYAPKASVSMTIDGVADESIWENAEWGLMDQLWIAYNGEPATPNDFSGRYKIAWDESRLYLLFEITDDIYSDVRANPLQQYWEDDCLEFFIDEDASGGDHTYNYNAFAYHVALDCQVVDLGPDSNPHLYSDHIEVFRTQQETVSIWEMAVTVFTSDYDDALGTDNPTAELKEGKCIGYLCAYCDSDQTGSREHFYGSRFIAGPVGEARNLGWQTADVFGTLLLVDE
ncbi:CBM9 family sugar-binding protein [bacterium]|nr:CBM9 family sugar-binding protein [bacterium]RQV98207.1 MAG: sugar-binding protein [bacterium]